MTQETKKEYQRPELKSWGTVADLTRMGFTHGIVNRDAKGGSNGNYTGQ